VALDLDEAAYGDPRDDLTILIADHERDRLRGVLSEAQLVQASMAYSDAYRRHGGSISGLQVLVAITPFGARSLPPS
jgi:aminoglycoside phosphotransferase (APT) family kinase protein